MTTNRLHPEGAPGENEKWMRTLFGDTRYEVAQEREKEDREWTCKHRELLSERQTAIVIILQLLAGILLVLLLLSIAAMPAVVSWLWQAFL